MILGETLTRYVDQVVTRPRYVLVLAPSAAVVADRERDRAKKGYGGWTVEQLDEGLRTTTPRIGLWIDSSGQTPDQTVDGILAHSDAARLA